MADREDVLAWLNGAAYRYVYTESMNASIVARLIEEGRAVRLGNNNSARVAITRKGFASLQQPSDGQEKKA